MARFYSNENFPLSAVAELRRLGHDVLTIQETGRASQRLDDRSVLGFATEHGRILLTLNRRHFVRLHYEFPGHSGIIACTVDPDPTALAARIHMSIIDLPSLAGQLLRVNRPNR